MAAASPNNDTFTDDTQSGDDDDDSSDGGGDSREVIGSAAYINMLEQYAIDSNQHIIDLQQLLGEKEEQIANQKQLLDSKEELLAGNEEIIAAVTAQTSWCSIVVGSISAVPFAYVFLLLLSACVRLVSQPDATVASWKWFMVKLVGAHLLSISVMIWLQICDNFDLPDPNTMCSLIVPAVVLVRYLSFFIAFSSLFVFAACIFL